VPYTWRDTDGPKILYPPNGAIVAWDGTALPLEAVGGKGPLRWLVGPLRRAWRKLR